MAHDELTDVAHDELTDVAMHCVHSFFRTKTAVLEAEVVAEKRWTQGYQACFFRASFFFLPLLHSPGRCARSARRSLRTPQAHPSAVEIGLPNDPLVLARNDPLVRVRPSPAVDKFSQEKMQSKSRDLATAE